MAIQQLTQPTTDAIQQPYNENDIGLTRVLKTHRIDLRTFTDPDKFMDANPVSNWADLSWEKIGRPYRVENWSEEKKSWEADHKTEMPVKTAWEHFNRSFHGWFQKDVQAETAEARNQFFANLARFKLEDAGETVMELIQLAYWNQVHRAQDAVWDPRGKRALFGGLDVKKPKILFLGAADGYEAMQLMAMYPGGHAVLVDYDDFCRTDRFGKFPEAYPFLGTNPATGGPKVWYREQMPIDFEVEDIRNLNYGKEFDIVVSIGLVEHFPDEYKPLAFEMHRKFVKPGGYVIMTTPRRRWQSKLLYKLMADSMNFSYRELMDIQQLGLYAYENGFDILRHGTIKAHNGLITKVR